MRIAFKFRYIHGNGLFTRLLHRIEDVSTIVLSLYQDNTEYIIEASAEQKELERVAEHISTLVPQSLFLEEYKIEERDEEDLNEGKPLLLVKNKIQFKVPYCPECQEKVMHTLNPFIPCSVCGFSETTLVMNDLLTYTGISVPLEQSFFTELANVLSEKGEVSLPTYNGIRRFSLLNSKESRDDGILYCNPLNISENFLITQGELNALMVVEKPTVRLKPKLMFRSEYELNKPFYPVFFADDKITLAFSTALKHKGIVAVYSDCVPTLRVASVFDEHPIVSTGRDMLPWSVPAHLNMPSFCEYSGFQAYGDTHGLKVAEKLESNHQPCIQYISNDEVSTVNHAIRFEPSHAAQRSIVLEHRLEGKSLCGIYFSKEHQSHIFSYSEKIGYTPMVLFRDQNIVQPQEMIEAIAKMDEGGMRLVENFKNTFPHLYDSVEKTVFKTDTEISDLTKLWSLAAVFIGLYEGDDALTSCEILEATAIEFSGKSGPRIDYKVMSTDEGYQLDLRLAIRSAMSFKLAGLDDYLLSFGFIDSMADFIAQQAEDADANIGINGVTLSGSLFENRQLLMRTYNALRVNYSIYMNKRLSIDGANVAIGGITLGQP